MGILVALPIAAMIAILDRRKIEEFLFLAIGIIVSLIIASGYFGNTLLGVYGAIMLGGGSLLYCMVIFAMDRKRFRESILTPGLVGGALCITVMFFLFMNKTDLGYDNDTFWAHAPQVINMYRNSDIGNAGARAITFQLLYSAPVYTSWCYFCNKLWFCYSDGINLWGRQIFVMAALMPFFSFVGKKEWKKLLFLCAVTTMLPFFVDTSYNYMPDIPVGAVMTYGTIMTVKLYSDRRKYNDAGYLLGACIGLMLLAVMKRAGGIYIYGIVGVAAVYTIDRLRDKKQKRSFFAKIAPLFFGVLAIGGAMTFCIYRYIYYEQNTFYASMPVLGLIVTMLTGVFCWILKELLYRRKYIALITALCSAIAGMSIAIIIVAERLLADDPSSGIEEIRKIFFRFFSMWYTREYYIGSRFGTGWVMPDSVYILILFVVILVVRSFAVRGRIILLSEVSDIDNVIAPVFFGYIVYMMFYCFIYMSRQGDYTVGGIGYADRYLGPAVMLTTAVVLYEVLCIRNVDHIKWLLPALVFLMLLLPYNPFKVLKLESGTGWNRYDQMYEEAGVTLSEDDNLLCIGPDHCQYYVFPAHSELNYEVKSGETDPEEWTAQILSAGYSYLLVEEYSFSFAEKYQDMFEGGINSIREWSIYDIIIENEKVRFVRRG